MDKLRLHPEDLKAISDNVSESLSGTITEILGRKDLVENTMVFTVDEVAVVMKCHKTTVLNHIEKGILKANKPGKRWVITQQDLEDYKTTNIK